MSVFADTSGLYAVLDADDDSHAEAAALWAALVEQEVEIVLSNYVLVELLALAQRRLGMKAVRAVCDDMMSVLKVHFVDASEHAEAVAALLASNRRDLSLVDCSSFAVMRSLHLRVVFGFDPHFQEQGFKRFQAP